MFTIHRITSTKNSTQGVLVKDANQILCYTLELPWLGNITGLSCIPTGQYQMHKIYTPQFRYHYSIPRVPGRTNIAIHQANWPSELKGCIALGETIASDAVYNSRSALKKLLEYTQNIETLIIRNI